MNRELHAVRTGLRRGWTEFGHSIRSTQDQGFYLFTGLAVLAYLWFNRDEVVEGTGLTLPAVAMPSILGGLVAFGAFIGPASALSMERQDGTLLRVKAVPHGMLGYVSGQLVLQSLGVLPMLAVVVLPSLLLFDGVTAGGAAGWLTMVGIAILGLAATLPFGIVLGSLLPGPQKIGTWGMLPIIALTAISGIFVPVQALWGWLQAVAQVFPMYWLGLGMRSAFLPDAAAAMEIGGSWRPLATVAVLLAWAIVGTAVAPVVLRRMARRQSGSAVAAARDDAVQWVR